MTDQQLDYYITVYRDSLMQYILPFWLKYGIDLKYGGYTLALDRDGTVIDTDKGIWQHGRFSWMLATLYNEVDQRQDWLDYAVHGAEFLERYGFDHDGRMFFLVDQSGRPVRKRRYVYSESFACIAFAALHKATGIERYEDMARKLFDSYHHYVTTPGLITPKYTEHRQMKGLGHPMIGIVTAQEMRKNLEDPSFSAYIDQWIDEIRTDFINTEYQAVMETVGPGGAFINHFEGRTLNPGHAFEAAWFILEEGKLRHHDAPLIQLGLTMLDWMWEIGWDKEFGGIFYFRDAKGLPVQEYWHEMKFWWPQNEAIIATLKAYELTGDEKYANWHEMIHEWTFSHFPDKQYGEWYGYLHRDGRISSTLKGNFWKGPFHIPRMCLRAWKTLESIKPGI